MPNVEKYKITSTERAKELGSIGGKVNSLAQKLINRRFCNPKCPMFNNCWAKHIAYSTHAAAVKKAHKEGWAEDDIEKIKRDCALKKLPSQVVEGAKRIILGGEEGFNIEMMEQITRLKNDLMIGTVTPRDRERYIYQLKEVKKSIYGDKNRIEANISKESLTAEDFAVAYEEHKKKQQEKASTAETHK